MHDNRDATAQRRTHIVMVPGFLGFDALGQVEYYARVTRVFRDWNRSGRGVALHYFDNFPTASVELRADRLLTFLAKRVARGSFAPGDRIALVGHSTGGLDIRKLLHELRESEACSRRVDSQLPVNFAEILQPIERVGFLSVPHFGTNFADIADGFSQAAQVLAQAAGVGLQLNREPVSGWREKLAQRFPEPESGLFCALADALNESDGHITETGSRALQKLATEREARAELALWLEHMARDFSGIADLRSHVRFDDDELPESPAQYTRRQREAELADWARRGLRTLSIVTRVKPPDTDREVLLEGLAQTLQWLSGNGASSDEELSASGWSRERIGTVVQRLAAARPSLEALERKPGLLFELCYELTARGPFRSPNQRWPGAIRGDVIDFATGLDTSAMQIEPFENDGIVNTLSMLWPPPDPARPEAHRHYLVEADHGEVIGHFACGEILPRPARSNGRRYYAYDFFRSRTSFDESTFRSVWEALFEFCAS